MMWTIYKNLAGNSGVQAYRYDEQYFTFIEVEFTDESRYLYTVDSCSYYDVLQMIQCAENGWYLQRYINENDPQWASNS